MTTTTNTASATAKNVVRPCWPNPNNIVLFQVGDFYEMFGEDAKTAAALLDLNLTTRPIAGVGRVEMCGIPVHTAEQSVEKLREFHSVTLAPVEAQTGERQPRTLLSQQEQAIQDSGEQGWNTAVTELSDGVDARGLSHTFNTNRVLVVALLYWL